MEPLALFHDFMDKGGNVLWAILCLTIWLWWIMLERYWYFFADYQREKRATVAAWQARKEQSSWYAVKHRGLLISEIECRMLKHLKIIPTLIALLPMFGLLGTVTGMIQVFDVMAFMGSGNPRAMANGVSAATIPTMAGMLVSLIAIPFATALNRRYQNELRSLRAQLNQRAE